MRALRVGVEISALADGIQLTDTQTGFAVELGSHDVAAMESVGPDGDRLWNKLRSLGLVDATSNFREVRDRQRSALYGSNPPLLERLRDLLARIRREVPFYRERAGAYDPDDLTS